jgi:hypothetical protein
MVQAIKISCISFWRLAHASRDCVLHVVRNPGFQTGALKQMDVFRIVSGAASPSSDSTDWGLRSHLFRCIRRYAVSHQGLSIRVHFRVQRWEHLIVQHHGHASHTFSEYNNNWAMQQNPVWKLLNNSTCPGFWFSSLVRQAHNRIEDPTRYTSLQRVLIANTVDGADAAAS